LQFKIHIPLLEQSAVFIDKNKLLSRERAVRLLNRSKVVLQIAGERTLAIVVYGYAYMWLARERRALVSTALKGAASVHFLSHVCRAAAAIVKNLIA
jgi:hypothetical protein